MRYSILGGDGFIGSSFIEYARMSGIECKKISRDFEFRNGENLGHVIYAIGLTADFRDRPMDTVRAHVSKLVEVLENASFTSFVYLSSTRVYGSNVETSEVSSLVVNPNDPGDLYNISKLMGEAVCLAFKRKGIAIARLSNVIGNDFHSSNFLTSLLNDALNSGKIVLQSSPDSEKDYVSIDDVNRMLVEISERGNESIYNVASGSNMSNGQITDLISGITNCQIIVNEFAPLIKFNKISTKRLKEEFGFVPSNISEKMKNVIQEFKHATAK